MADTTVVVLGGSSGIGLATAKAAQADGARVVITGRSRDRLDAAISELGGTARAVALDAVDEIGTRELFAGLQRVDHVFITAGTVSLGAGLNGEMATLRPALDTRFWGALYGAKYAAPKMDRGGSITFMSGTSAWKPRPGGSVGSASCGAVEAFARSLAIELAPIRVNTIAPGFIDTPLIGELMGERRAALIAQEAARLPVRRIGRPEDIADAVLFLMRNGFVTGITLTVDGGRLLI
ncbi:MAG TPA: SDR family oxidoreductase [Candidatus Binataceae bacterium]|nr:SDR family oxidoreductase [Candidatus Binataceae bacterium]